MVSFTTIGVFCQETTAWRSGDSGNRNPRCGGDFRILCEAATPGVNGYRAVDSPAAVDSRALAPPKGLIAGGYPAESGGVFGRFGGLPY